MIRECIYVITTTYATFAIITDRYDKVVKAAAPIAKWTIGKSIYEALRYYIIKKNATIEMLYVDSVMQ